MKKLKEPVIKGVAKTPLIMQLEALECGAASLTMVMAYYGKWVPLERVREDTGVSRDGSNAKNILAAARKYGFKTRGFARTRERLQKEGVFPCIIHWNRAHFVVLNGFGKKCAYLNDPAKGVIKVPFSLFDQSYTGICLELTPDEGFEPGGKPRSVLSFAKKRMAGAIGITVLFSITTIVFYVVGLADPLLEEAFVNDILSGTKPNWLLPFILIMGGLGIVNIITTLVKQIFTYKVLGKLSIEGNTSFMWKILKLPIGFFSQRMVGDIQNRKDQNASIASDLVNIFAPLLFNLIMLVVYLVFMIQRSYILTIVGIVSVTINVIVSQALVKKRINITRVFSRDSALLSAHTSKGIEMIETIKSSGGEDGFYQEWSRIEKDVVNNQNRIAVVTNTFNIIPSAISLIIELGITFLGVYFAIIGQFAVGTFLAFQSLLAMFMTPATSIINSGQQIQEMRTAMERVEDVMNYPDDPNVVKVVEEDEYKKSIPDIEIKNLTFGYSRLGAPLLKNFNLTIKKSTTVAIVGGSGSGKSTLAKLLTGLYAPWEGDILYNGRHIIDIDRELFSNMVSLVDQQVVLFEDTVANNIKMWDRTIENFEMILAAKDACIHDEIMDRGGYDYYISEGGKNFSGGEKQRIEIARALVNDPSCLILDEATSALDAQTEYKIIKAIESRGITCVVIAHRLSTIKNADLIVVLEKGVIVEQGNHEELMAKKGSYYNLIKSA